MDAFCTQVFICQSTLPKISTRIATSPELLREHFSTTNSRVRRIHTQHHTNHQRNREVRRIPGSEFRGNRVEDVKVHHEAGGIQRDQAVASHDERYYKC